jgi:hypothetical protein
MLELQTSTSTKGTCNFSSTLRTSTDSKQIDFDIITFTRCRIPYRKVPANGKDGFGRPKTAGW